MVNKLIIAVSNLTTVISDSKQNRQQTVMAINLGRSQRESIKPSKATPNNIGPGTYNAVKDFKEQREK